MRSFSHLFESWGEIPRTLYIHKLVKAGEYTKENIEKLKQIGVFDNSKDIFMYSFIHPDSNMVCSFTGSKIFKPGLDFKVWYSLVTPLRNVMYKGGAQGQNIASFSAEKIPSNNFNTTSYLFSGEKTEFKKIEEIETNAISTTIPIPVLPFVIGVYENYELRCAKNKHNISTIVLNRTKGFAPIPQVFMKSNYFFTYNCKVI